MAALMSMLAYQCHLKIRDSDKSAFEFRAQEFFKFLEHNDVAYQQWLRNAINPDLKNPDGSKPRPLSVFQQTGSVLV